MSVGPLLAAESSPFTCAKSADANPKYLKDLQATYDQLSTYHAEFSQNSQISSINSKQTSSGMLWLNKAGQFRWDYLEPVQQTYLLNQKQFSHYMPEDFQVNISEIEKAQIANLPLSFLAGGVDLSQKFKLTSSCFNGGQDRIADLTPIDAENAGFENLVLVNNQKNQIVALKFTDLLGNQTEVIFNNLIINQELPTRFFQLDLPDDVYINKSS